jgi:hypothetical protein
VTLQGYLLVKYFGGIIVIVDFNWVQ